MSSQPASVAYIQQFKKKFIHYQPGYAYYKFQQSIYVHNSIIWKEIYIFLFSNLRNFKILIMMSTSNITVIEIQMQSCI